MSYAARQLLEVSVRDADFLINCPSRLGINSIEVLGFRRHENAAHFEDGRADQELVRAGGKIAGWSMCTPREKYHRVARLVMMS